MEKGYEECDKCDYYISVEEAYKQGYEDAIDELVSMVARYYTAQERAGYYSDTNNMIKQRIADFGEQLKENNNDSRRNV